MPSPTPPVNPTLENTAQFYIDEDNTLWIWNGEDKWTKIGDAGNFLPINNPTFTGTLTGPTIISTGNVSGLKFIITSTGRNLAFGYLTEAALTSGSFNTAIGYRSQTNLTTGNNNTALGDASMGLGTITGSANTAVGSGSLLNLTSGADNTAYGWGSLKALNTGNDNVAIGANALLLLTTGIQNTALGIAAGNNANGSGNVFLGHNSGYNETGSNKLYIANSNTTTPLIYGDFSTNSAVINGSLGVTSAPVNANDVIRVSDFNNSFVSSVSNLQNYSGPAILLNLTDSIQGGIFTYSTATLTDDSGVVFPATGKGSGHWVRQYDLGDGIKVAWWGDTFSSITKAVAFAGNYGKIVLTPNKTYLQTDEIIPLTGQVFEGNYATLQRQLETSTTLTATCNSTDITITVASVPATWHVGDYIQMYQTVSSVGASYRIKITDISGTTITLANAPGVALYNSAATYASGSFVRKVFHQITSTVNTTYTNNDWTLSGDFSFNNVIFDGQSSITSQNLFWGVNAVCYSQSYIQHQRFIGCQFLNIPNDCLNGHGFYVTKCYANNLNNSFVHLSGDYSLTPKQAESDIFDNGVSNCNQVLSTSGSQHSEGVITLSFTGGYSRIHHNVFNSGLNNVLGLIQYSSSAQSGAARFLTLDHNMCYNFAGILTVSAISSPTRNPGNIQIDRNIFSNCGSTSPFPSTGNALWAFIDKINWGDNILCDGTAITVPIEAKNSTEYILNQTASTQTGDLKISGAGTFGSIVGGTVTGTTGTYSSTLRQGNNGLFSLPNLGGSTFTPTMGVANTAGPVGLEAAYADGTNNYRVGLVCGASKVGITASYSTTAPVITLNMLGVDWFTLTNGVANIPNLTASKPVFTDASKNLVSTGPGTSSQFLMGNGSLGKTILTASATLDFPLTNSQTSSDLTMTVTGAADGDTVMVGVPNAISIPGTFYTARVSAADTVTVTFNNYTTTNYNPGSGTFKVTVIQ